MQREPRNRYLKVQAGGVVVTSSGGRAHTGGAHRSRAGTAVAGARRRLQPSGAREVVAAARRAQCRCPENR